MEYLHLLSLFALNFPKGALKKQYLCQDLIICLHILSNLPFIFILDFLEVFFSPVEFVSILGNSC